jgi:protein phosphatase
MTAHLGQTASLTDTGRKRRHNEDAYVVEPPLFAVADGMGGAQAGEHASSLAAAALKDVPEPGGGGEERVDELIQQANRRVYERQSQDAAASGMGTTMTVALVEDGRVAIGHVGDSRAYLIRGRSLEQLTEDHSLVAELVRSGKLSPEEAEGHPQRSVITRALGTDPDVDVDTFSVETRPGDLFLICSDGLTSMVDNDTILTEVARNRDDLKSAAKALVRAANNGGGEDNITVVFFEIDGAGDTERMITLPPREDGADAAEERTRSTSSTECRRFSHERPAAKRHRAGLAAAARGDTLPGAARRASASSLGPLALALPSVPRRTATSPSQGVP